MSPSTNTEHILAIDLGGTKVAAAVIDTRGEILFRCEEPTCQDGPQAGIEQIARLVRHCLEQTGLPREAIRGIGVGIPAVLDPQDLVIWAPNLKGWRNVDLKGGLEAQLNLPAFIEYDGHTAVLGEWWQGAGRGYQSIAMIIIGTGIGGGLIVDGRLFRGFNRLAGAAGWFAMTASAASHPPLSASLGHWESLAAGPAIASRARELLPDFPDSRLHELPSFSAREVFENARSGDALAIQCVDETAGILGLGVANIVSLTNPEIIILGGSIGSQGDLLETKISEVVRQWAQPISAGSVMVRSSELGTLAGLYGAAYAVIDRSMKLPPGKE
ncbi:MAG TPA: ROK family protein [Anaerolineales bacterium]|jgi:glucokinase